MEVLRRVPWKVNVGMRIVIIRFPFWLSFLELNLNHLARMRSEENLQGTLPPDTSKTPKVAFTFMIQDILEQEDNDANMVW